MKKPFKSINWNRLEDKIDLATLEKLNSQIWLDTRIPVSNDLDDWSRLSEQEKTLYDKVLAGLTTLDTLQSEDGAIVVGYTARTQHERAVMNNIAYMEGIHAKSYSTIFSTLRSPRRIDEIFKWTEENEYLQYKTSIIKDIYDNGTHLQKRVASVFLESFLFYSGFFTPLYYVGMGKMSNVAEIIKLIVRDESVHGTLGYKHCFAY